MSDQLTASTRGWKRVGKLSGPANTLDGRFQIVKGVDLPILRQRSRFFIVDLLGGIELPRLVGDRNHGYSTMRDARSAAEVLS